MPSGKRTAVTFLAGLKLEQAVELSRQAGERGITDGWSSDAGAPDSLTSIAAVALQACSLRIGVAMLPVGFTGAICRVSVRDID